MWINIIKENFSWNISSIFKLNKSVSSSDMFLVFGFTCSSFCYHVIDSCEIDLIKCYERQKTQRAYSDF